MIFAGLVVGLAFTIQYAYIEKADHYHQDLCSIHNCTFVLTDNIFVTTISYRLYLYLTNATYTKYYTYDSYTNMCNNTKINCYYDDRNITQSLRLQKYIVDTGVEVAITALCITIVFMIICMAHSMHYVTLTDTQNSNTNDTNNTQSSTDANDTGNNTVIEMITNTNTVVMSNINNMSNSISTTSMDSDETPREEYLSLESS